MIAIFEKTATNCGLLGGKFLEKVRVPKPGSVVENPVYYSPADFAIGATVEGKILPFSSSLCPQAFIRRRSCYLSIPTSHRFSVFSHRFEITDADRFVLTYLESIASQIPCETLESLRRKFGVEKTSQQQPEQNGNDQTFCGLCFHYCYFLKI